MCIRDRICGDVGFGKTEVALRAAFIAITGGKQVAFLAPTTLLAEQHYQTPVSYTHLRAHETVLDLVCRLLLAKKKHDDTNPDDSTTPHLTTEQRYVQQSNKST